MPRLTTRSDALRVRRARQGDRAAYVEFTTRWWPTVSRLAWGMLGDTPQAISVTGEAFVSVLEGPNEPELPAGRCLYRLAIFLSILRRRAKPRVAASPLLNALDQLDHLDRAAWLLRDAEELSSVEIAAVLETDDAEVRERTHRARVLLMRFLHETSAPAVA